MPEIIVSPGIRIPRHAEGRVLLGEPVQGRAHLFLVSFRFRFNANTNHGFGEGDPLKHNRRIGIAKRIPRRRIFQADNRRDLACIDLFHFFAIVRVHANHAPDALLIVLSRI